MKRTPKAFVAVFSLLLVLSDSGKAQNFIVENFDTEGQQRRPDSPTLHNRFFVTSQQWVATPFITDTIPEGHWYEVTSLDVFGAWGTFTEGQARYVETLGAPVSIHPSFIPQFSIYGNASAELDVNFNDNPDSNYNLGLDDEGNPLDEQATRHFANANIQVPSGEEIRFENRIPDQSTYPTNDEYLAYRPFEEISSTGSDTSRITRVRYFPIGSDPLPLPYYNNIRLEGDTVYWLVTGMQAPPAGNPTESSPHATYLFRSWTGIESDENGQWDILPEDDREGLGTFAVALSSNSESEGRIWQIGAIPGNGLFEPVVFQFGIQANLVPEPSATLPVVALALCISAIVLRKMRKPVRSA